MDEWLEVFSRSGQTETRNCFEDVLNLMTEPALILGFFVG
jgi:hypothetical protein